MKYKDEYLFVVKQVYGVLELQIDNSEKNQLQTQLDKVFLCMCIFVWENKCF